MQIHEQTQRFILLLIFYLLGPILTLGIVGTIVVRKLPFHARRFERSLTLQTGLHWTIQSVEYRSPNFVRLHRVQILDETAQRAVFYAPAIDLRLKRRDSLSESQQEKMFPNILSLDKGSAAKERFSGLSQFADSVLPFWDSSNYFWQIEVSASYLNFSKYSSDDSALLVQNLLRKLFARFGTLSEVPIYFIFEEIAVVSEYSLKKEGDRNEDKVDMFRFVQGNIYRTSSDVRSLWSFQIDGISERERGHLSFVLAGGESLKMAFRTEQPIPCSLAAVFCSSFKPFSGGTFLGEFSFLRNGTDAAKINLKQAHFTNIPLAQLVQPYTDFTVEGTLADLRLQQAVFAADETYAEGSLQVTHGAIDKTLFHKCVDRFQLTVDPEEVLDLQTPKIPFTECAVHFRLLPGTIDFWADQKWGDLFMFYQDSNNPYSAIRVRLPAQRKPVSYLELMSLFANDRAPVVPLTTGLKSVLTVLPIQ